MCRMCGARPAGALRSSLRRWLTPNRCCSSTTATSRRSNSTASSISACVPTRIFSSPDASFPSRSVRRDCGVEPVSSAAWTSSPGISFCSVAKCCSASVSVGAISAAWPPDSTARSIAYSATTVLPEPTSPISRRCIGRSDATSSSSVAIARCWSPVGVNGSESRSQRAVSSPGALNALRPRALAAARAAAQERDLQQQELVEREPSPAALLVAEVRGVHGRPAVRQALQRPDPGGQRLEHVAHLRALLVHERGDLHARQPVRGRVGGHVLARDTSSPVSACSLTRNPRWPWYLPVSRSRVPGR